MRNYSVDAMFARELPRHAHDVVTHADFSWSAQEAAPCMRTEVIYPRGHTTLSIIVHRRDGCLDGHGPRVRVRVRVVVVSYVIPYKTINGTYARIMRVLKAILVSCPALLAVSNQM